MTLNPVLKIKQCITAGVILYGHENIRSLVYGTDTNYKSFKTTFEHTQNGVGAKFRTLHDSIRDFNMTACIVKIMKYKSL
jgi:hypothetical protein